MGVFAPLVGIIGAMQAAEALKLVAGIGTSLAGRLQMLDARDMSWTTIRVAARPRVPGVRVAARDRPRASTRLVARADASRAAERLAVSFAVCMKHRPLKARNFRSAGEDAAKAKPPSLYDGPGSAYHLAFTDLDFLLQDELRPVRVQLELMKPEMVQAKLGIESTIVLFGSARIKPPEAAQELLAAARQGGDALAIKRAESAVAMSHHYVEARTLRGRWSRSARATSPRRSTWSPAAAPASWRRATAARSRWAARASA